MRSTAPQQTLLPRPEAPRPEASKSKLPWWYQPMAVVGTPTGVALALAVPYAMLKQLQDNLQQGTKTPLRELRGLGSVATQQVTRGLYRLGPIPMIRELAGQHHPEGMSTATAKNVASGTAIVALDVILGTPSELLGTKQRTFKPNLGLPYPTGKLYYDTRLPIGQIIENLYGKHGAGAASVLCRTGIFIPTLMAAKTLIDDKMKPEGLLEQIAAATAAAGAGAAASVAATPVSVVQGRTTRFQNSMTFGEAVFDVAKQGTKAWTGASSRAGLAFLGGFGVVATMTLQDLLKRFAERQEEQQTPKR